VLTGHRPAVPPGVPPGPRPGLRNPGFGQITPRIVDLLYRSAPWARAISIITLLGIAAGLVFCGFAWVQTGPEDPLVRVALSLGAVLALAALLPPLPLLRFARSAERMTLKNQGESAGSAFDHLGFFWSRVGILLALYLLVALGAGFLVRYLAPSEPMLAAFVEATHDPRAYAQQQEESRQALMREERETRRGQSPFILKEAAEEFGRNLPLWVPTPNPPASPGRRFTFDQLDEACQVADTTFLCLVNRAGEPVGGGSRWVVTGDDAIFVVLPQTDGPRSLLEVNLAGIEDSPLYLRLAPPEGFPLMQMAYEKTTGISYSRSPFLEFRMEGSFCRADQGRFNVRDLALGADGLPDRLVVDFEVRCDSGVPALGRLSVAG
jgi:hypothetical protein